MVWVPYREPFGLVPTAAMRVQDVCLQKHGQVFTQRHDWGHMLMHPLKALALLAVFGTMSTQVTSQVPSLKAGPSSAVRAVRYKARRASA
jgi:hypothetical protein